MMNTAALKAQIRRMKLAIAKKRANDFVTFVREIMDSCSGKVGVSGSADHTLYKKEVVDVVSSNLYRKKWQLSLFLFPYS